MASPDETRKSRLREGVSLFDLMLPGKTGFDVWSGIEDHYPDNAPHAA